MTLNGTALAGHDAASPANPGPDADIRRARWSFSRAGAREQPAVEGFIRRGFERAYGARLTRLMPTLMTLQRDGEIVAACGLRSAAVEPLFLETYLDRPIDVALSRETATPLTRSDIVEVGNLVIARAGYARRLIFHLTTHLHATGPAWVVFTAVPALRNNFRRLGIPLVTLGAADGHRLPAAARAEWGDYYEQEPVVTAVCVEAAYSAVCEAACTR